MASDDLSAAGLEDDSESLLDEPVPQNLLRRDSSSSESSNQADEAGLTTTHTGPNTHRQPDAAYSIDEGSTTTNVDYLEKLGESSLADSSLAPTPRFSRQSSTSRNAKPPAKIAASRKPGRALAASTNTDGTTSTNEDRKPNARQNLTLKEQEKLIDITKKENFSLKLKIYFLEERLAKLAPEHIDTALKENIELKVDFQTLQQELKKHKRMCLELNKLVEQLQAELEEARSAQSASDVDRIQDLEEALAQSRADHERDRRRYADGGSSARDDAQAEIDRLKAELAALRRGDSGAHNSKQVESLTKDNASLLSQINAQVAMLAARNSEKDQLYDNIEQLKQANLELETQLSLVGGSSHPRSSTVSTRNQSTRTSSALSNRSQNEIAQQMREMEDELNHYRDKFSSTMLEMERKEAEIEDLLQDGESRDDEHLLEIQDLADETSALQQAVDKREDEIRMLVKKIDEFEQLFREKQADNDELVGEIKGREAEIDGLNEELDALTEELKKLGQRVYQLEEELASKDEEMADLHQEVSSVESKGSIHQQVVNALKEKLSASKMQINEMTASHESIVNERNILREQVEQFALQTAETEERSRSDLYAKRRVEDMREELDHALRQEQQLRENDAAQYKRQKRVLELDHQHDLDAKDKIYRDCREELQQAQERLKDRQADLNELQKALRSTENQSRSHSSTRSSLEIEISRMQRDLSQCEAELEDARATLRHSEEKARKAQSEALKSAAENKDLSDRLAAATQLRAQLTDKLDASNKALREAKQDVNTPRAKSGAVERVNFSKTPPRTPPRNDNKLVERNALLHRIYIDVENATNHDGTAKPKDFDPATEFRSFSDALISKIQQALQVHNSFTTSLSEVEKRYDHKYNSLKQQHDARLRQLDRLETTAKHASDTQRAWRNRVVLKQNEVDAAKATNQELQTQIASLRQRMSIGDSEPGSASKLQNLYARASTAERRLASTQAQLADAEDKLEDGRQKLANAENIWRARLEELNSRLRAAQERNKAERQGGKEKANELGEQKRDLERQLKAAERRRDIVGDYVDDL